MRFKEFNSQTKNKNQKVDEVLPMAAGAARAVGGAVAGAAKLGASVAKTAAGIGSAAAQKVGTMAKNVVGTTKQAGSPQTDQNAQAQQPIPMKVGTLVPMANPIGRVKINKIEPHSVTLDTQAKLGMNLKVDPAELGNYMQTVQGKVQK